MSLPDAHGRRPTPAAFIHLRRGCATRYPASCRRRWLLPAPGCSTVAYLLQAHRRRVLHLLFPAQLVLSYLLLMLTFSPAYERSLPSRTHARNLHARAGSAGRRTHYCTEPRCPFSAGVMTGRWYARGGLTKRYIFGHLARQTPRPAPPRFAFYSPHVRLDTILSRRLLRRVCCGCRHLARFELYAADMVGARQPLPCSVWTDISSPVLCLTVL